MSTTQDIIVILDESLSMEILEDEPIKSINLFIKEQQNIIDDATFSLWKFNNKVVNVYNDIPLKNIEKFEDFNPKGMTALYDAIGQTITNKLKKEKHNNVICLIVTDGLENSSRLFNNKEIKDLIMSVTNNNNWKFIYMGANQDSFQVGSSIGIDDCVDFQTEPGSLETTTLFISETITQIRSQQE